MFLYYEIFIFFNYTQQLYPVLAVLLHHLVPFFLLRSQSGALARHLEKINIIIIIIIMLPSSGALNEHTLSLLIMGV